MLSATEVLKLCRPALLTSPRGKDNCAYAIGRREGRAASMTGRLRNLASMVSLVLCVATNTFWVRSYFVADHFPARHLLDGRGGRLQHTVWVSWHGRLIIQRCWISSQLTRFMPILPTPSIDGVQTDPDLPSRPALDRAEEVAIRRDRRFVGWQPALVFPAGTLSNGIGFGRTEAGFIRVPVLRQVGYAVPYWFICALTGLPAALWFRRARRMHLRRVNRLCFVCGYDLRASHNRCSECGTPIPARGIT